jgi:hypothetical protein
MAGHRANENEQPKKVHIYMHIYIFFLKENETGNTFTFFENLNTNRKKLGGCWQR